jgi:deoxyribodipyrimidine photo-lyase
MKKALFWHRRDLRIEDNAGLFKALKENDSVQAIFIFDKEILDSLPKTDQRVIFIHQQIKELQKEYEKKGSSLLVYHGDPVDLIPEITRSKDIQNLYANRDYEPYAQKRDKSIHQLLQKQGVEFFGCKDQVIFEKSEVTKDDSLPYGVFTPYSKKWKAKCSEFYLKSYPVKRYAHKLKQSEHIELISLKKMGFSDHQTQGFPSKIVEISTLKKYKEQRDIPSITGTSKLSVHLRFGTISIRQLARFAQKHNETFLNELIWREFYQMILYHFPHTVYAAYRPKYDFIPWINNEEQFNKWCEGKTGYPLVDAGMRELNETGFMHNRVRMVVASFLCKHLLIDWRWGEAYFAEKLLDFDLASNIGGWQWASGSGCDAAPYFRVFSPEAQQKRFDPQFIYIKKWVKEFGTKDYSKPVVEHKMARLRAIDTYKKTLN